MVRYNPYIVGQYNLLYTANKQGQLVTAHFRKIPVPPPFLPHQFPAVFLAVFRLQRFEVWTFGMFNTRHLSIRNGQNFSGKRGRICSVGKINGENDHFSSYLGG